MLLLHHQIHRRNRWVGLTLTVNEQYWARIVDISMEDASRLASEELKKRSGISSTTNAHRPPQPEPAHKQVGSDTEALRTELLRPDAASRHRWSEAIKRSGDIAGLRDAVAKEVTCHGAEALHNLVGLALGCLGEPSEDAQRTFFGTISALYQVQVLLSDGTINPSLVLSLLQDLLLLHARVDRGQRFLIEDIIVQVAALATQPPPEAVPITVAVLSRVANSDDRAVEPGLQVLRRLDRHADIVASLAHLADHTPSTPCIEATLADPRVFNAIVSHLRDRFAIRLTNQAASALIGVMKAGTMAVRGNNQAFSVQDLETARDLDERLAFARPYPFEIELTRLKHAANDALTQRSGKTSS